jgi:hypothetical protein
LRLLVGNLLSYELLELLAHICVLLKPSAYVVYYETVFVVLEVKLAEHLSFLDLLFE